MSLEDPIIRAKVLEWQKKHQISDDDPAMALIELLAIYNIQPPGAGNDLGAQAAVLQQLPPPEEFRTIISNSERTNFLLAELKETISNVQLVELAERFKEYHEGIDYATQKMALIIKEGDDLLARLAKVAAQINPVARGAILVLMIFSGIVGWLVGKLF
jgi:hypothetical protein